MRFSSFLSSLFYSQIKIKCVFVLRDKKIENIKEEKIKIKNKKRRE
jgi:hypothetical protein